MKLKHKKNILISLLGIIVLLILLIIILRDKPAPKVVDTTPFIDSQGRLIVVTSIFPVYDFAKVVGGDKAVVSLILPSGHEAHAYTPSSDDKEIIKNSAIFFYTSNLMESWAPALASIITPKTKMLATADKLNDETLDPHVWLDFSKASLMVDNILNEYKLIDPQNSTYYEQNAIAYKQKLADLDLEYMTGLKDCKFQEFISGGHFAFGYLAKRYNLKYQAAQSFIPDSSLDTDKVLRLSKELKDTNQPYVYYEETIMPYLAELMHQTSGARIMPLNSAHNIQKYDVESGITFISLMKSDLGILKTGLGCR
jgi:zinc transport system substrate-binding protein